MSIEEAAIDGRRARRTRNRIAVIDAAFELLNTGMIPPTTEAIAERAGVSVSSIFRYFDSLDDLQQETIDVHMQRFAELFLIPAIGEGTTRERIDRYVDARLLLHREVAPIARLARARALDHPQIAAALNDKRSIFAEQVRQHFAQELSSLSATRRRDVVATIDTLTSFESWALLGSTHGLTSRVIRGTWTAAIDAVLDAD